MREWFYLTTIEIGRTPRAYKGTVHIEQRHDAEDFYFEVMKDVCKTVALERSIPARDENLAKEIYNGTVLFYHVQPCDLGR